MNRYIDNSADCNVKQFMDCCFKEHYRVLILEGDPTDEQLKAAHEMIYAQYADLSGLFVSREFELSIYIHSLENRINTIVRFIELQKAFIQEFSMPFVAAFPVVKKYGHSLYWNHDSPDVGLFLSKLDKVSSKEKRYNVELAAKKKELFDLQRKKIKGEHNPLESRKQFITMLNRLAQAKFVIDKNATSVEELALMIKDMRDQQQDEIAQRSFKKR